LIRFVRAPDGAVVPDLKRRLPGRGVWVEARKAKVQEAVTRKVFARGFKTETQVPAGLAGEVEALIERSALDMLSLANKAGRVVTGFGKVETALDRNSVAAVLHADDAAEDGKRKLAQAARRGTGGGEVRVLSLFSSRQMDLALGRQNVVHAALLADPVSDAFIARAVLLARYRDGDTGQPAETD
jgi:predicted RNA-binding protein YlxR (DUF448 family)